MWSLEAAVAYIYTIAMALNICKLRYPFLSSYGEVEMLFHLEKHFECKCLTKFPEDSIRGARGRLKKRVYKTIDVNNYVCADIWMRTYFGEMACCENC